MRSRIDSFAYLILCLIVAAGFLLSVQPAHPAVYKWNGSQSSDWQNPANWNGGVVPDFDGPPAGETWGHRLEVNQTATREELIYDSSLGTTVYASPSGDPHHGRGLIMGNGVTGAMRITGGTFSTWGSASADLVGHQSAGNGTLIIDGGNYISSNSGLHLGTGSGGTSNLTINAGSATITTLRLHATTATVNLNGGMLQANRVDVQSGTNTFNFNGGTLVAGASSTTFMEGLNAANVQAGGAMINTNGFNITIAQMLLDGGGGGGLTKQGSGVLTLSGENTYTGVTTVSQGTLKLGNHSALGTTAGKTVVESGATLDIAGFKAGTGTPGGEWIEVSGVGVGGAGALINSGASQTQAFSNITLLGDTTFGGTGRWDLRDGTFAAGGHKITKVGTGLVSIVRAAVTDPGDIDVNGGTFRIEGSTNWNAATPATIRVAGGARFDYWATTIAHNQNIELTGGMISANSTSSPSLSGTLTLNAGNNTIGVGNEWQSPTLTITGRITGDGGFALNGRNTQGDGGTGILIFTNTGNDYVGDTAVNTGTLRLGAAGVIPNGSGKGNLVLNAGSAAAGTFDLNGFNETVNGLQGTSGAVLGQVVNNAVGTASVLTVGGGDATSTFAGILRDNTGTGGTLALAKIGTGTLTLSGENTYTGDTNVDQGALRITNPNALGTGAVAVANTARLELAGNITVTGQSLTMVGRGGNNIGALQTQSGQNTWAGDVTIGAGETRIGASGAGNTLTISGAIDDGGNNGTLAVRNNNGTTILAGENTYGGNTDVVIGLLKIDGGDNRLPVGTVLRMGYTEGSTAASFDLSGWNQQVAGLLSQASTMPLTVTNSSTTASTLTVNNTGTHTYVGGITGNLALTKDGAGTLVLGKGTPGVSGENTYTGATTVKNGVLRVAKDGGLGTGETTVEQGGHLELSGGVTISGQTIHIAWYGASNAYGALRSLDDHNVWDGPVYFNGSDSRVGAVNSGSVLEISGEIRDGTNNNVVIVRNHLGKTVFSGANTYTGETRIYNGTLELGAHDSLPAGNPLLLGIGGLNATFELNGFNQTIGTLRSDGVGSHAITNTGGAESTLTISQNSDAVFGGAIANGANALHLVKTGGSRLTLSGTNTHTGLTTVDAGTLHVTGSLANGGSSHVRVASAGTDFGASDPTIIRRVDIGGSFAGIGSQVIGPDTFATRADLLAGGNDGSSALDLGMAWRAVSSADAAALPPLHNLVSDVLRLDGMANGGSGQTDPFVLQMSYDAALLQPNQDGMFLAWLSAADGWVNAVEGNLGTGGSAVANFQAASGGYAPGSWDAFVDAYNPIDLDLYLGSWGLDSTNQMAWAVLNHNSQFAIMAVPEPSALLLGCLGLLGLLLTVRRRR
ncbi:MAG: autotransporter-associated beta strand repeat-containing protein [Thermoguttaceae bacterium]|jgi:autotransporter-associated beta strand protein|nr:autotransporter-associated beta strand repeat-containing protein [Thermoguttaceae bacterium]